MSVLLKRHPQIRRVRRGRYIWDDSEEAMREHERRMAEIEQRRAGFGLRLRAAQGARLRVPLRDRRRGPACPHRDG